VPTVCVSFRYSRGRLGSVTTAGDSLFQACSNALDFFQRDFWRGSKPRPVGGLQKFPCEGSAGARNDFGSHASRRFQNLPCACTAGDGMAEGKRTVSPYRIQDGRIKSIMKTVLLLLVSAVIGLSQAPSEEINTLLMHSTFRIVGPSSTAPGKTVFGTVFFMGRPLKNDLKNSRAVLVTAGHVLDDIGKDTATLALRRRNTNGSYTPFDFSFKIRKGEQNLYIKHPEFDVAAMYIEVPEHLPITVLPPAVLADDKRIEDLEIHPGDTVLYLGFPLAASTQGGFPFLRGGRLSSYPLIPVNSVKEWNIDGPVEGGNSGGPVYFYASFGEFVGKWRAQCCG
jgi:hypothetical protein